MYFLLLLFYATVPPVSLFFCLKWIYKDNWKYGWHLFYFCKYLITLSFLPLLFIPGLELGLIPKSTLSLFLLFTTFLLAILGIKPAIKRKVLYFYLSGIFAAFMEEIVYRSIIFALSLKIWGNVWIALAVNSFFFGCWHLKNYHWSGKHIIYQFLYTALFYGPVFSLMRIYTGDIYLAILYHYVNDAACALAPDYLRGWLVRGGRGGNFSDDYQTRNRER